MHLFTCTHGWGILEIGGGKIPCRIIVLIRNDYFNEKKYSDPIILGDYVEKGSDRSHKTSAKDKVGGSKLELIGQPPQEVYRTFHARMYGCFPFMCVAEYLRCRAGGAKYRTQWAAVAPIYD